MNPHNIRHAIEPGARLPGSKPFEPGQLVRDRATQVIVRVAAVNPPHPRTGNPRRGFSWVNTENNTGDKDHTGFCPEQSAGCFELVPQKKTWRDFYWAAAVRWFTSRKIDKRIFVGPVQKFDDGKRYDSPVPVAPLYPVFKRAAPTAEQTLAATCAGAALGALRAEGTTFIYEEDLASDALALAREILKQSEAL